MNLSTPNTLDQVLIVSLTPYFLEKNSLWFEQNIKKILEARKTQTFFEDNTLFIAKNQKYNFSQFLRKLDELGYEKVYQISEPGEFSQRGGIVDVFPVNPALIPLKQSMASKKERAKNKCGVNLNYPLRFEFFGNQIANIEKLPVEVKDEKEVRERLKKKLKYQRIYSHLGHLKSGDLLVHLDHGVGIFNQKVKFDTQEYYQLEYAGGDKLYIPLGLERKLSQYVGFIIPKISRLGSSFWQKTKKKIKEEVIKFARELLEIYAKREIGRRPPYLPDDEIDFQLASSFQYSETPDQVQAIEEIKKDLEKDLPMDRIICGDVGFGKTEVALRMAVKAVKSGYQVAMICPTTILANQHFQNFKERLKNLPIKIAMLSRLQSKKEQKEIIEGLKSGEVDIVVGTHRILSKDVEFLSPTNSPYVHQRSDRSLNGQRGLGLLVVDDEQRFGVRQKEKLKKLKTSLDVLSLSATPIPRTLYMALSSLKDISLIQTPPVGRLPIKTFILPFSEKIIKKAIENEIKRGGQVYYLHNRVETIETAKKLLECLNWRFKHGVRFGIAHGRLKEKELVKVMADFQNRKIDVLVATTIIENGLDLPNVNTLIVADAARLGLSQAYQIRGRVGRSYVQALAYFFYSQKLTSLAKERLDALKEAEELGSGYRIALKDLEIRGAGNILGKEQSGNINKVGLNLYCQMLSDAIEKIKSQA